MTKPNLTGLPVYAKDLLDALLNLNHVGSDERGGYCICPCHDGGAPDHDHATSCANARTTLRKVGAL